MLMPLAPTFPYPAWQIASMLPNTCGFNFLPSGMSNLTNRAG